LPPPPLLLPLDPDPAAAAAVAVAAAAAAAAAAAVPGQRIHVVCMRTLVVFDFVLLLDYPVDLQVPSFV
jgi:hypothetical protein